MGKGGFRIDGALEKYNYPLWPENSFRPSYGKIIYFKSVHEILCCYHSAKPTFAGMDLY